MANHGCTIGADLSTDPCGEAGINGGGQAGNSGCGLSAHTTQRSEMQLRSILACVERQCRCGDKIHAKSRLFPSESSHGGWEIHIPTLGRPNLSGSKPVASWNRCTWRPAIPTPTGKSVARHDFPTPAKSWYDTQLAPTGRTAYLTEVRRVGPKKGGRGARRTGERR